MQSDSCLSPGHKVMTEGNGSNDLRRVGNVDAG